MIAELFCSRAVPRADDDTPAQPGAAADQQCVEDVGDGGSPVTPSGVASAKPILGPTTQELREV